MERARKRPQLLLVLLAAVFAVAAIWAATALAAGDSSAASSDPGSSQPAVEFVQAEDDAAPSADDCPEDGDGSGGGSGGSGLDRIELDGLLARGSRGSRAVARDRSAPYTSSLRPWPKCSNPSTAVVPKSLHSDAPRTSSLPASQRKLSE